MGEPEGGWGGGYLEREAENNCDSSMSSDTSGRRLWAEPNSQPRRSRRVPSCVRGTETPLRLGEGQTRKCGDKSEGERVGQSRLREDEEAT